MPLSIKIITIFPEFFSSPLSCGLLGKAVQNGLLEFQFIDPRDYARDRHKSVDDKPYGGGPGMVMLPEPLDRALSTLPVQSRKLLMDPGGHPFEQKMAADLAREEEIVLVCGRYEGIDARIPEKFDLSPLSVGDFVLNGGESAALCVIEAVSRQVPGFMGKMESAGEESFSSGLLEYPQYTRPEEYAGLRVPPVLLSGDHGGVDSWRHKKALEITLRNRPDLLEEAPLTSADVRDLRGMQKKSVSRGIYLALVHYPVLNKWGETGTTSLTNLDIHDIGRVSHTYGIARYFLCTPVRDQKNLAHRLLGHWVNGAGGEGNPYRADALARVEVAEDLSGARQRVQEISGMDPLVVSTSARWAQEAVSCRELRKTARTKSILLVLGTGYGLAEEAISECECKLRPLRFLSEYNHMSVRSAASIILDRIVGDFY